MGDGESKSFVQGDQVGGFSAKLADFCYFFGVGGIFGGFLRFGGIWRKMQISTDLAVNLAEFFTSFTNKREYARMQYNLVFSY